MSPCQVNCGADLETFGARYRSECEGLLQDTLHAVECCIGSPSASPPSWEQQHGGYRLVYEQAPPKGEGGALKTFKRVMKAVGRLAQ